MARQECEEHIPPLPASDVPASVSNGLAHGNGILSELSDLAFPYSVSMYPGKQRASALALGLTVASYETLAKPCRERTLGLPLLLRAAKFCGDQARAYEALSVRFAAMAEAKRLALAPKRRGMLEVRVRDDTGIPRNAIRRGNGNAPGFDKPGGKNLEPF